MKKMILVPLVALIGVAIIVFLSTLLKLDMWIVFMGFLCWSIMGMPFKVKDIIKNWLSVTCGLGTAWLLQNGQYTMIAALVIVLAMIFCMVNGKLSFIFNNSMAIVLTAGTAVGLLINPVSAGCSVLFGFVVLGLLPALVVGLLQRKKSEKAPEAPGA